MNEAIWGLVGVIVGGGMTIAKDAVSAWRRDRKSGSFSAIRLVGILHEYADHCIGVVDDDGTSYGRPAGRTDDGEEYYVAQVQRPNPPEYPEDIVWRSLPKNLMFGVLALPNKARLTNRHIDGVAEYVASYPDFQKLFEARQEGYAKLGIEALTLADSLAAEFRFTIERQVVPEASWDPKAYLLEKVATFDVKRKKRSARNKSADKGLI